MAIQRCGRHHTDGTTCARQAGHHQLPIPWSRVHTANTEAWASSRMWGEEECIPLADEPTDVRQAYEQPKDAA